MPKYVLFVLCFLSSWQSVFAQKKAPTPRRLTAEAFAGDGVQTLLARFRLDRFACNFDEFYTLNKLKKGAYLKEGQTYSLPIKIYTYDKKSIKTSLAIKDNDLAQRVQIYNDKLTALGIKSDFRTSKEIWLPHHSTDCMAAVTASVPKERNYPVFGKSLAQIEIKDTELAGTIYYLISGHGGPDPGAMAKVNKKYLCEDEYAYDVTLRLARNLLEHGARVYLITIDPNDGIRSSEYLPKDTDEYCYPKQEIPVNQKQRLTQRTDIINSLYTDWRKKGVTYQRVVEIHVDSRSKKERIELFFYHAAENILGKQMTSAMRTVMAKRYADVRGDNSYKGNIEIRDLHTLRECLPPAVFIELGNINNISDRQRIMQPSNRQTIANWLAEGLLLDY